MKVAKTQEVEKDLQKYIEEIEEAVFSGDYSKAFSSLQRAKALTHYIKVNKLWNKGNKYFALINQVGQVKNAFERKDIKKLEDSLNSIEKTLLS
jgi:hypothetical protein